MGSPDYGDVVLLLSATVVPAAAFDKPNKGGTSWSLVLPKRDHKKKKKENEKEKKMKKKRKRKRKKRKKKRKKKIGRAHV